MHINYKYKPSIVELFQPEATIFHTVHLSKTSSYEDIKYYR